MVSLGGEKMSKSKGNLVFVSALRAAGIDPMAIRLALLAHHYRDDWEWSDDLLVSAKDRLSRWREAVRLDAGLNADEVLVQVRAALARDSMPHRRWPLDAWAGASTAIDSDAEAPAPVARTARRSSASCFAVNVQLQGAIAL
jgi:L-cysteine:1D-myo-inositol 2-amino-2-deoxy-alpha-D-glucopyranoside ligase